MWSYPRFSKLQLLSLMPALVMINACTSVAVKRNPPPVVESNVAAKLNAAAAKSNALAAKSKAVAFKSSSVITKPAVFPEEFPIAMTFHSTEKLKVQDPGFAQEFEKNSFFPIVAGLGNSINKNKVLLAKSTWPDKVVLTGDAYGGVGRADFPEVWPGHVLYKERVALAESLSAQDTELSVENYAEIASNDQFIQRLNDHSPYTLTIYALDKTGKPDWSRAEYVVVKTINPVTKKFTIERGQWGTKPLAFQAGNAVVAARMMFWSGQWQLNLSLHSPRGGKDNLTAAEWFARKVAARVIQSNADGIEFDVGRWTWGNPEKNRMDANNDGVADYGYIDGVNSFGLGGQVFFRELRQRLGSSKIIQVDSNDAIYGVRGWKYINGVQMESFPAANHFDLFSNAFLHLRMWAENVENLPKFSYPLTKTPTTVFANNYLPGGRKTDFRFRVGLAASCITGMPHAFASMKNLKTDPINPSDDENEKKEHFGAFLWDEYQGGDINNKQWLGRPLKAAQQDLSNLSSVDLLAKAQWQWAVDTGFTAKHSVLNHDFSVTVQHIPSGMLPEKTWTGVKLTPQQNNLSSVEAGQEYTLEFEARGDDNWNYAGQTLARVPRMITISGEMFEQFKKPLSVLVDSQWRIYRLSFTTDASHLAAPIFGVAEQIGSTELRNIKLYKGGAERWVREFEKGLVLLNMTNTPWRTVVKNNYYKRLKGNQALEINNGLSVDSEVVVPAQDALFLRKR